MHGVRAHIESVNCTAPPPIVHADIMRAFTIVDITSENFGNVLEELVSNSNQDNSWPTSHLMNQLKENDPGEFQILSVTIKK